MSGKTTVAEGCILPDSARIEQESSLARASSSPGTFAAPIAN
jgi:hypothetical protein